LQSFHTTICFVNFVRIKKFNTVAPSFIFFPSEMWLYWPFKGSVNFSPGVTQSRLLSGFLSQSWTHKRRKGWVSCCLSGVSKAKLMNRNNKDSTVPRDGTIVERLGFSLTGK
jgi:hypothetical protein